MLWAIVAGIMFPLWSHALNTDAVEQVKKELAASCTAADSMRLYYDLFDLNSRAEQKNIAWSILDLAKRTGDDRKRMDILRNMSNMALNNDSLQEIIELEMKEVPESDEQRESLLFIQLQRISTAMNYGSEAERMQKLNKLIEQERADKINPDIYTRIFDLFAVCNSLGEITRGEMLSQYFDELGVEIAKLPYGLYAIRNLYYTHAAIQYTNNNEHKKAINADQAMLAMIDNMERTYHEQGRRYRNYERSRFVIYRRLLNNYEALSLDDVDHYYKEILKLREVNEEIAKDMDRNPRSHMFYNLAHGNYAQAIPYINKCLTQEKSEVRKRDLLRELVKSARATGNKELERTAMAEYNDILEEYIKQRSIDRYAELQLQHDMESLRQMNSAEQEKNRQAETKLNNLYKAAMIMLILLLIGIIYVLYRSYRNKGKVAEQLQVDADTVRAERDVLQETQKQLEATQEELRRAERFRDSLIGEMSHELMTPLDAVEVYTKIIVDSLDDEQREYMTKFVDIVNLNTELLKLLVTDVLGLAQFDNSQVMVEIGSDSIKSLCDKAIEETQPLMRPGVELRTDYPADDTTTMKTAVKRVVKVLTNLLSNAAKFTKDGSVTLSYRVDQESNTVTFAVTDTGIGIDPSKADAIFERFVKLGWNSQGLGLGLPVCRLIAKLLKGEVRLDTSYTEGARFVFTIPLTYA